MKALVTVGSTSFKALTDAILEYDALVGGFLENLSCSQLLIQSGSYLPDIFSLSIPDVEISTSNCGDPRLEDLQNLQKLKIKNNATDKEMLVFGMLSLDVMTLIFILVFSYSASIDALMSASDLIVCHCGMKILYYHNVSKTRRRDSIGMFKDG